MLKTLRPKGRGIKPQGIKYISSGPLISQDKTIALQQELTAKGNHAVISFDNKQFKDGLTSSCDTTRRAIVTIKTHSLYNKINEWVSFYLGKAEFKLLADNNDLGG